MLLAREDLAPVDAVRRLVGLQAQEPASPYIALWNRLLGFEADHLDAAFRDFELVKASLMRITLHAVAAEDRGAFHAAMSSTLRAARLHDDRFRSTGLTIADADAIVSQLLAFSDRPRNRKAIEAMLAERLGTPLKPGVWWALRSTAPLVHAPQEEPWSFGRAPSFMAAPDADATHDRAEAIQRLIVRYLEAFGPASRRDVAQFALLKQSDLGPAFAALTDELVPIDGPGGVALFDVPGAPLPDGDEPAPPRLLAMWDSVLLAYKDRGRVIPSAYRSHVIRRNGDVLPTVLVDGYVAGVWRHVDGAVEVTAFEALDDDAWDGIEDEARSLLRFVNERDDAVYGRFGHWWSRLPDGQVRVVRPG